MSEIQYNSVSSCDFKESGRCLDPPPVTPWEPLLPCIRSSSKAVIRLTVMERLPKRRSTASTTTSGVVKWTHDHFHSQLRAAASNSNSTATSSSLSLLCCFQAMARESLLVALSPSPSYDKNMLQVEFASDGNTRTTLRCGPKMVRPLCRVGQERAWTSYWVCYHQGKLYAGVGPVPGEECVAILDATTASTNAPDTAAAATTAATAAKLESSPSQYYVGFGNAGGDVRSAGTALFIRHVRLTSHVPDDLQSKLEALSPSSLKMILLGENRHDAETAALLEEYQQECEKQKARAKKFGMEYKEPPMTTFTTWSEARRLQLNPKEGFVTGINLMSPTEIAKQESRKKRFGDAADVGGGTVDASGDADDQEQPQMQQSQRLTVEQAWDNDENVHQHRIDPPPNLWKKLMDDETNNVDDIEEDDPPTMVEEKIHLFSIDWAPFKQIRTSDVMNHFALYGPSYVEWLGDLSCNVIFSDSFTAARALHNLSLEIPSPPPESLVVASTAAAADGKEAVEAAVPDDLGRMGWRMGKTMLRKTANDRFGRRGTSARLLMRIATNLDVLQERPTTWPKPPRYFSTKRVLVPKRFHRGTKREKEEPQQEWNPLSGDEHPLLSRGLASGRGNGFSAEELEAERAKKRAKVDTGG